MLTDVGMSCVSGGDRQWSVFIVNRCWKLTSDSILVATTNSKLKLQTLGLNSMGKNVVNDSLLRCIARDNTQLDSLDIGGSTIRNFLYHLIKIHTNMYSIFCSINNVKKQTFKFQKKKSNKQ